MADGANLRQISFCDRWFYYLLRSANSVQMLPVPDEGPPLKWITSFLAGGVPISGRHLLLDDQTGPVAEDRVARRYQPLDRWF